MASVPHERRFDWYDGVVERFNLKGTVVSIAWRILQHLNAEKGEAWPSETAIAAKLGIDERTVRRGVADLARAGFISVTYGCGRHQTNRYRLALPDGASAVNEAADAVPTPEKKGDSPVQKGGQPCPEKGDRAVRGTLIENPTRTLLVPAPENRDPGQRDQPPSSTSAKAETTQPGRLVAGLLSNEAERVDRHGSSFQQRHANDGEMERQLAERIGSGDIAAGFGIVFGMDGEQLRRLLDAVRFGRLTAAMVEDARLTARMAGPVPVDDRPIHRDASMRLTPPPGDQSMSSGDPTGLIEQRTRQHHAQT